MSTRVMEPGREVGGYRVEGLLGRTPWSTTYAAVLGQGQGRYVALKVLEVEGEIDPDTLAKLESTLVQLVDVTHPGVLGPIDAGEIDELGQPFVVTPLAEHPSIEELVKASPLSPDEVRDLLARLGAVLDEARKAGVSHLSLKPTNVFVGAPPELAVSVVDFGMHVLRKGETPKDDVHGAAKLAVFALTGADDAVEAAIALDEKLGQALKKALSDDADRFETVTALADAVKNPAKNETSERTAARHAKASQQMPVFKLPEHRTTRPAPPSEPLQTKTVQMKAFGTKQFSSFKLPQQTQKLEAYRLPIAVTEKRPQDLPTVITQRKPAAGNKFTELARSRPLTMLGVSAGIALAGILAAVIAIVTRH